MNAKDIKKMAAGRWAEIIRILAPHLARAIDRMPHHVPCPVHGGKDGFRVFNDFEETGGGVCNTCGIKADGYALLMWANGWDFKTTHEAIKNALGIDNETYVPKIAIPKALNNKKPKDENADDIRATLNHVWKNSVALSSPEARVARLYLANRGISIDFRKIDSNMIRFVPALEHYEEDQETGKYKLTGKYPAIVTIVCDANGRPSTIHRTYLTNEGKKAPVRSPKKMMRHCADNLFGAMRIAKLSNSKVLAITEGIETALAVMSVFEIPAWAAGNAYLLENFVPPKGVDVVIFADKDRPSRQYPEGHGQTSARILLKRLWSQGVKASIKVPDVAIPQGMKSVDWLDVVSGVIHAPAIKTVSR